MTTISTADRSRPFEQNRLLQCMTSIYLFLWGLMAIAPLDRTDWPAGEHAGICVLRTGGFDVSAIPTFRSFVLADICFFSCCMRWEHITRTVRFPIGYWNQRPFRVETERFRSSGAFLLWAAVCVSDSGTFPAAVEAPGHLAVCACRGCDPGEQRVL